MLTIDKYNRLDKIVLTEQQHSYIMEWDNKHHKEFDSIDFPFTECLIEIPIYVESFQGVELNRSFNTLYYMKIDNNYTRFKQYDKEDMKEVLSFSINETFSGEFTNLHTFVRGMDKDQLRKQAIYTVLTCFAIFQYINHRPATIVTERASRAVKKKGKGGKGKSKITRVNTVRYTFDLTREDKREYTRKTESWKVRGHYRHYKDGRKVWIKPTVKGKGKTDSKTYTL